ncbi:MAG TPA: PTS sugar transporter subunit IIA [Anaerolineales bacterium]|nr:PTS sugar transporter subunit IIA [Anaerolineales bacterium]
MVDSNSSETFHLSNLISQETVQTKVNVKDWEEATESVGKLLVSAGKIKPDYITAMKRVLKEMGPYAVIAPGIVLLHARPEDGVLQPCLGLITLIDAVPFGHSENDPVDLVFALGAVDKMAHISALQQLAEMLGDSEKLKSIRSASNSSTLLKILLGEA